MQVLFPVAVIVQQMVLVPLLLILGTQIVHINEFEGKLTLYSPLSPSDHM